MTAFSRVSATILFVFCTQVFAQGSFDHASYPVRDADQIVANAPKVESVLTTPEGRKLLPLGAKSQAAIRIIAPEKIRLQVALAQRPTPLRTDGTIIPHENALRIIGWNPPPRARYVVSVKTKNGNLLRVHIQDVLVDPLVKEVQTGRKVTFYALLYYFDKDGPGILVNEFRAGWH